jgi:anaerobic dimethyl sulfoxide reductase subunit B
MNKTQFGFSLDLSRCTGCMSCIVACLDQNDLPDNGSRFRHVSRIEMGAYPDVNIRYVSLACMHCGDAPCVAVCPTRAIVKRPEDGIVVVHEDLCIGCHTCATVCPFGAPQFPDGARMSKCDFCVARVENGLEPACVRTCTTKALGFGPIEKLTEQQAKKASELIVSSIRNGLVVVTSRAMKG